MKLEYPLSIGSLTFPRDEGRHPQAMWEWWYLLSHLDTRDGERFAVMLSFSNLGTKMVSVSDYAGKVYLAHRERTTGLFSAEEGGHDVNYGPSWWRSTGPFRYRLHEENQSSDCPVTMDLSMSSLKPPLAVGGGARQMGYGGVTYWYALTRMRTRGRVEVDGHGYAVRGLAWEDRQWGDWDWFGFGGWKWLAVQLDNGHDLMLGEIFEPGTRRCLDCLGHDVGPKGETVTISDLRIRPTAHWRSTRSHARYPVAWSIQAREPALSLSLTPPFPGQELAANLWEGSAETVGMFDGRKVRGHAFVEYFRGAFAPLHRKAYLYGRAAASHLWANILGGRAD